MLSLASFVIAGLGLGISIVAFMLGNDENKPVRIGCGVVSIFIALIFVGIGMLSGFLDINLDLAQAENVSSPAIQSDVAQADNFSSSTINLGTGWTPSNISPAGDDTYRVYSHYPQGSLRYISVYVDDDLTKVEKVCSTSKIDITYMFSRRTDISNPQNLPYYQSDFININGCRIDFTVIDNFGGNMGIDILEVER